MPLLLTSAAFRAGQPIPIKYTCDGPDVSPPLAWEAAADGLHSLGLICDDPDAPTATWVHWVLFNLPADSVALEEGIAKTPTLPNGARQGRNDFKRLGYDGPCPPRGRPHRYFFRLYALDVMLSLPSGVTKPELLRAMSGHILERAELMGTYQRR